MQAFEAAFPDARRFELFTGHKSERNLVLYQRLGYAPFRRHREHPGLELIYLERSCVIRRITHADIETTLQVWRASCLAAALFVDPRFQGRGLGKRLLDHAKAQSSLLRLSVFAQNPRAVKFYQREGFWATDVKGHGETEETIVLLRWEAPRVPVK